MRTYSLILIPNSNPNPNPHPVTFELAIDRVKMNKYLGQMSFR